MPDAIGPPRLTTGVGPATMTPHFFSGLFELLRGPFMKEDELVDECVMWCTFLEYRHYDRDKGITTERATDDERIAYDVYCFCGMIDADGISALLSQPEAKFQSMSQSMRRLGLAEVVDNVNAAADALRASGLFPPEDSDRERISGLVRPFEETYYRRLRKRAYSQLKRFIQSSDAFLVYAQNIQRCEREGANCNDPKEWSVEHGA
jgi:hypothetical protein